MQDILVLFTKSNDMQTLLLEHTKLVLESVSSLESMVHALHMHDIEEAKKMLHLTEKFETDADTVHRENVIKICKGSFFGYLREDLLQFMECADDVADSAKEAARVLMLRKIPEGMLSNFLTSTALNYVKESCNTARSLLDLIKSLKMRRDVIIEKVKNVEQLEENADTLKNILFHELYESSDYDTLTVLQLKEFINIVDKIADSAEDASDVILIMLAKGYS